MAQDDRRRAAQAALDGLPAADQREVVLLLCRDRPEAVLAAVEALQRHRRVVAGLLSTEAPEQRAPGPLGG